MGNCIPSILQDAFGLIRWNSTEFNVFSTSFTHLYIHIAICYGLAVFKIYYQKDNKF